MFCYFFAIKISNCDQKEKKINLNPIGAIATSNEFVKFGQVAIFQYRKLYSFGKKTVFANIKSLALLEGVVELGVN